MAYDILSGFKHYEDFSNTYYITKTDFVLSALNAPSNSKYRLVRHRCNALVDLKASTLS